MNMKVMPPQVTPQGGLVSPGWIALSGGLTLEVCPTAMGSYRGFVTLGGVPWCVLFATLS